jgi:hypothetical protein
MARRLAMNVYVNDDDGTPTLYKANTVPPAKVAEKITNPAAWQPEVDEDDSDAAPPTKKAAKRAPAKKASAKKAEDDGGTPKKLEEPTGDVPADDAGDETWRAYAATVGVTVNDDADTAAVKAELTERGLLDQ